MTIEIGAMPNIRLGKRKDVDYNHEEATLKVESNKLVFSKEAAKALQISANDRVMISYWTVNKDETFPLVGRSEWFTDHSDGNRVTKSNTVSFRGQQNTILRRYGDFFTLEPFKNYYKLVPKIIIENDNLTSEESDLNKLN